VRQETVIVKELLESFLADVGQKLDGAIFDFLEKILVNAAEEGNRFMVPAPPKVIGQLLKPMQSGRQMGKDRKST